MNETKNQTTTTPVSSGANQQNPETNVDNENYCGYPYDPTDGKPYIDDVYSPSMKFTNFGVPMVLILIFFGVVLSGISIFITSLAGALSTAIITCMVVRFTSAMRQKGVWLPERLIRISLSLFIVSYIIGIITVFSGSAALNLLEWLLSLALAATMAIAGSQIKKVYSGAMARMGNAFLVIGIISGVLALLNHFTSKADPGEAVSGSIMQSFLGDTSFLTLFFMAVGFTLGYMIILWPFRIMAKMFSNGNLVAAGKLNRTYAGYIDFESENREKQNHQLKWVIPIIVIIFLVSILLKLH